MKIVLTGGHPSPAFALVEYVQSINFPATFVMIGRSSAMRDLAVISPEEKEAEKLNVRFYKINSGRSGWYGLAKTLIEWQKIITSTWRSFQILNKEKPDCVVSFGSYVSIPTVIASWLLRIPILTHEQTFSLSQSNRFVAKLAKKLALSFSDTKNNKFSEKSVVVGLPLRLSLISKTQKPEWWNKDLPFILILGGSTGSHFFNHELLPFILKHSSIPIIHQTGDRPDHQVITNHKNYEPRKTLSPIELAWCYAHTNLVISRAGANTTAEIIAWNVPTVFIPLPNSANQEQQQNANFAKKKLEWCEVISQNEKTPFAVMEILADYQFKNVVRNIPQQSLEPHQKLLNLITHISQS